MGPTEFLSTLPSPGLTRAGIFCLMASILLTNDDGIHADGLAQLAESLAPLGDTIVVAPEQERSAVSHALTLHNPLRIREMADSRYAIDGTPADCVYLGALQVMENKPDLIVSGINRGANIGDDVTYSGTIAAALEGTILGVRSIAISQEAKADVPRGSGSGRFDFTAAGAIARRLAEWVLETGIPSDILLNVNVPAGEINGLRITRQGKRTYDEVVHEGTDPRGSKYYWIGSGLGRHFDQAIDTDYTAVRDGYVSLCPLHLDLTHHPSVEALQEHHAALEASLLEALGA